MVLTVVVNCNLNGSLTAWRRRGFRRQRQEREQIWANWWWRGRWWLMMSVWGWWWLGRNRVNVEREGLAEKSIMPLHFIENY